MKKRIFFLFCTVSLIVFSQQHHISFEGSYRSYGVPGFIGNGFGIEYTKDTQKKWLGYGINVSFFQDKNDVKTFRNPYDATDVRSEQDEMNHFKISPFAQLFVLNSDFVDLYFTVGIHFSVFNHYYFNYRNSTEINANPFDFHREDIGYKGLQTNFETGFNIRLTLDKFFATPNVHFVVLPEGEMISMINLKAGFRF